MNDLKFDLNDISIIPAETTEISSRSECDVMCNFNDVPMLPLIAAPMDTVVSVDNYHKFISYGIIPCIPRGADAPYSVQRHQYFQAFGLCEIEKYLMMDPSSSPLSNYPNVLIDIANGHMGKLIPIVKDIKEKWPNMKLMVGNVANPETFANLGMAGADFVRISIGTGAGCTTAANVAINYPMGSLITECRKEKVALGLWNTNIVADGGMSGYDDIIKALGLGSDYVMIGSIFNKAIESAGFNYLYGIKINQKIAEFLWRYDFPIKKKYRGMSTKAVQRSWGKTNLVTAEGITKYQKVEYTLGQWIENFKDYLKSNMSYSNAKKLSDFIGYAQYVFVTENARKRIAK